MNNIIDFFEPLKIFNLSTKRSLKYQSNIEKKNYLFIVSHEYSYFDWLLFLQEILSKKKELKDNILNIVIQNDIIRGFKIKSKTIDKFVRLYFKMYNIKYNFIYKELKNTCSKVIDKLNNKENVLIFIRKDSKGTGLYHIINSLNENPKYESSIYLVNIKEKNNKIIGIPKNIKEIVLNTLNKKEFELDVKKYKYCNINDKVRFMDNLKNQLYG